MTLRRHFQPGIRQIWIAQLGVVDRCQTCHAGLAEASLTDVKLQPFRTHPPIPHSADQFGCVICHRGQGEATTVDDAHHCTLAGEEPLLPARYMEASCGQCHHEVLKGTPKLNQGRLLMSRYGCSHCHSVKLPDGSTMTATDDPPALTHIEDKTTREWIYAWLKDPASYSASATMPNFKLSDADARDISALLIANSVAKPGVTTVTPAAATPADPAAGASICGQSFCASCHAAQNAAGNLVGRDLGPDLTHIGNKVKPEWLEGWLSNPRSYDPNTRMPRYRWTGQQLALVKAFLLGKADSDFLANVHLDPATPSQIVHGKALVTEYGCAACHEIGGIKKTENFAPDLSRIGGKPVVQLVFTQGMRHSHPDYISGKIRQPRAFGQGLRMPEYSFTPEQVDALTTALLALTDRSYTLPISMQIPATHDSDYRAAGAAGKLMDDMNCYACHRINGRRGDMAPDLTWEGSSVQRKWLGDFSQKPNTLRPALLRRMPKFNISDSERATLADYIMTAYQTPAFDRDELPSPAYAPALAEQGRQLFYSRYSCQSCHIVDTKQDKGYIGPPLYQVGLRLTPAWIFHYLKNPQALRPGTIEPNQKMSDDDARALTSFLMTQKAVSKQEGGQ